MATLNIDSTKCIGCGLCVKACPFNGMEVVNKKARALSTCTVCGACVERCKFDAITLEAGTSQTGMHTEEYSGIWVYAQVHEGRLKQVSLELLGCAKSFSRRGPITCVLPCPTEGHILQELVSYGADSVLVGQSNAQPDDDAYCADILAALIKEHKPEILLIGATSFGRSLAPRVAAQLKTGLTADCTSLSIAADTGLLQQTRPAFGGNLMATILCPNHRPQIASVRPKVFRVPACDPSRTGDIIQTRLPFIPPPSIRKISTIACNTSEINIQDADIIIAVGKGIGNAKNIRLAYSLASALGGVVGASRAVVDMGWMPYSSQVGQTGKTVSPKLYIACGVSGAVQHTIGLADIDTIVAINKDPDAPIFGVAHFGIVGDCLEVLPLLTQMIFETQGMDATVN